MRSYRARYSVTGQNSPVVLSDAVFPYLRGDSLADVGCGAGIFGYIFKAAGHVKYTVGIDFSERAVDALRGRNVYDEVHLADSTRLPIADDSVDTALSMENLEHLYPAHVAAAIEELVRISRRQVIITTPAPWDAVNHDFLAQEIPAASADPDPMAYGEFSMLASYLHVGWVEPQQMRAAGFHFQTNRMGAARPSAGTMLYWGSPDEIDLGQFGTTMGVSRDGLPPDDDREDWRSAYRELLIEIAGLPAPPAPRSLGILQSGASVIAGLKGLARLGR